ncbi:acyl carrier protein [Candidatus Spongiihabitans sp.]|uniref:acyl carrier protein n=1 Tax=Candidatus Spongiihabitans sp. TaxID=3101308 RepID=UPI003C6F7D84
MSDSISKVKKYILDKNSSLTDTTFLETTDIIENRLIDSLQFVEFILFVEEIIGRKIDIESINIDDFRTLKSINQFIDNSRDDTG